MKTLLSIKAAAALLLVASLALPQSTCAGYRGPEGKFVFELPRDSTRAAYTPAVQRHYALEDFQVADAGSWFTVSLFVWPLVAIALGLRARGHRVGASIAIAEPILAIGSAYVIWFLAAWAGDLAAGAYVALGALGIYFGACVVEIWRVLRKRRAASAEASAHAGSLS